MVVHYTSVPLLVSEADLSLPYPRITANTEINSDGLRSAFYIWKTGGKHTFAKQDLCQE